MFQFLRKFTTLRKLRLTAGIGLGAAIIGLFLANVQAGHFNPTSSLGGILDGGLVGSGLAVYHLFVFNGGRSLLFRSLNFVQSLFLNTLAYTACIICLRTLGHILRGLYDHPLRALEDPLLAETTIIVLLLSMIANFLLQISDLIGAGDLVRFVFGRYHQPRTEQRVFLFIDLVSSTSIAERTGPVPFLRLLDTLYRDMTEPILRTRAEVYKYVGDEIILTWTARRASVECLRFMRYLDGVLAERRAFYEAEFGLFPRFRAALHGGEVVSGEMGLLKKEIAYMGDVLNTTARIVEACRKLDRPFLCSAAVVPLLGDTTGVALRSVGQARLRGRAEPVVLLVPEVEEN
jgi:adenylate cyclase